MRCVTCVVLLVCVDCLFPLHDVLKPTEKSMGCQRVTLSLAHGSSASNITVQWLLAGKVFLILTPSFINKQLLSIICC